MAVQAATASGSGDARSAPRGIAASMTVTGEIQTLGLSRIAVGGLGCTIPSRLAVSAGRFVIGDPVKIACLNGTLRSVKYSPELATAQSDQPGRGNAPTTITTPPPAFNPATAHSISYTVGTISLGGGPTGDTNTATGPISDLSDGSITAGPLTCSFKPFFDAFFSRFAQVDDNVTLTCTGGTFVGMASVGTITRTG